eukprot:1150370-Pelagomonas_calceolata.AAC.8
MSIPLAAGKLWTALPSTNAPLFQSSCTLTVDVHNCRISSTQGQHAAHPVQTACSWSIPPLCAQVDIATFYQQEQAALARLQELLPACRVRPSLLQAPSTIHLFKLDVHEFSHTLGRHTSGWLSGWQAHNCKDRGARVTLGAMLRILVKGSQVVRLASSQVHGQACLC